jgi:hypothetical protein
MTEEEREVFYRCLVRINSDLQEYCEQIEK